MRFLILILITLSILPQGLSSQRVKLNKGKPSSRNYLASVSYRDVQGKIIIPVEIEGNTYQFLFDTGAPNLITQSLSEQISFKPLSSINVRDANDSSRKLDVVSLPLLAIGSARFENTPTIVNDPDSNFILDCFGVDGIIGSNMVRKSVVHIDPESHTLTISNESGHFGVTELPGIELTLSKGQSSPHLWIRMKGKGKAREYVLFDTGMNGFYDMSLENFEKLNEVISFDESESGEGIKSVGLFDSTESSRHHRVTVPEIEIGPFGFQNVMTITMNADRSRIGSEILKYGKVTLDYRNSRLYFEPIQESRDLYEKSLGFSPTIRGGKVVVGIVWSESLKSKLSFGDEIISVNGAKISESSPCNFVNRPSPFENVEMFNIQFRDQQTGELFQLELIKQ